jgi:hypothetical protein
LTTTRAIPGATRITGGAVVTNLARELAADAVTAAVVAILVAAAVAVVRAAIGPRRPPTDRR